MGLGPKEPSFDYGRDSDSSRWDGISHNRAARGNARSLLGRNRDLGRHDAQILHGILASAFLSY